MSGENPSTATGAAPAENARGAEAPKTRKRRRWVRRVALTLIVLAVLVWSLPYLASTGAGTALILAVANSRLAGRVEVKDLSLSWLGPCQARDVGFSDDNGTRRIEIGKIDYPDGLWRAIVRGRRFGRVRVEALRVVARAAGAPPRPLPTLQPPGAGISPRPARSQPTGSAGQVDLASGAARIVLRGGGTLELPHLEGRFDLTAAGAGRWRIEFDAGVRQMSAPRPGGGHVEPIDLDLTGAADLAGRDVHFRGEATGTAGKLSVAAALKRSAAPVRLDLAAIVSAVATGQPLGLPDFDFQADGQVDLAALAAGLPALLKLRRDVTVTAGTLAVQDVLVRGGAAPAARGKIALKDVEATRGGRTVRLEPITVDVDAALESGTGLRVRRGVLASSFARVDASGVPASFKAKFTADLARLRGQLGEIFDLGDLELTGAVAGEIDLARTGEDRLDLVLHAGATSLACRTPAVNLAIGRGTVEHTGHLTLAGDKPRRFALTKARVELDGTVLAARDGWYDFQSGVLESHVDVERADLGKWLPALVPLGGLRLRGSGSKSELAVEPQARSKEGAFLTGRLGFSGTVRHAGAVLAVSGSGGVDDLRAGVPDRTIAEKRVDFDLQADFRPRTETVLLKNFAFRSEPLTASATGTVRDYRHALHLDLSGSYQARWDRLTPLLHELFPDMPKAIALSGEGPGEFRITGPLRRPQYRPPFRAARAAGVVTWGSGQAYGVTLGKAALRPELTDGRVRLPVAAASTAAGGEVRLGGVVDFTKPEPALRIDRLQPLKDVEVTVELGEVLLSRFNPIFHKLNVARLTGRASLSVRDVDLPLGKSIRRLGAGAGRLELTGMSLLPAGFLAELLTLAGVERGKVQPVRVGPLDFTIDKGRIAYKDFAMTFAETIELHFAGWVGFDDTLQMVVSIPVTEAALRRFGVGDRAARYAGLLTGARIPIPIRGTRQKPGLDLKAVDIGPLLQRALEAFLAEEAGRKVRDLLDTARQPRTPQTQPATRPAETLEERLIEEGFKFLREVLDRKKP